MSVTETCIIVDVSHETYFSFVNDNRPVLDCGMLFPQLNIPACLPVLAFAVVVASCCGHVHGFGEVTMMFTIVDSFLQGRRWSVTLPDMQL